MMAVTRKRGLGCLAIGRLGLASSVHGVFRFLIHTSFSLSSNAYLVYCLLFDTSYGDGVRFCELCLKLYAHDMNFFVCALAGIGVGNYVEFRRGATLSTSTFGGQRRGMMIAPSLSGLHSVFTTRSLNTH